MLLRWETVTLRLRTTFRTAHGASDERHNVIVRLEHEGRLGLGEAAGLSYHGESPEGIAASLQQAAHLLQHDTGLFEHPALLLHRLPLTSQAARAAVDVALHDLWAQRRGEPVWRLFGLDGNKVPKTSFTVALDTPEAMARRASHACIRMPILKLKLGGEGELDEAMVAAVRAAAPEATIRVDANAGWTREQAAHVIPRLAGNDLELVEQPLAADDIEGLRRLREQRFGVPIFADESVCTARDVEALAGAVDGVVIKLMKCGGLHGAQQAIAAARAHGMQVMIGSMIESSVGATAAAHLSPLCDLADLDGPLLISNDPFRGVGYDGALLLLPDAPGLGVVRLDSGEAEPHTSVSSLPGGGQGDLD